MQTYVLLTYVDGALVEARECDDLADVLTTGGGKPIVFTPTEAAHVAGQIMQGTVA